MNIIEVGERIAFLRKLKGLTQSDLGERVGVSFQAVSKWERGETLPDTALLPDLAEILDTTVDNILSGGNRVMDYKGKITVAQMADGIGCLKRMCELLGRENIIYRSAIEGIDEKMNTSIEDAFTDEYVFECFVAEAAICRLRAGAYIDPTDVRKSFKSEHFRDIVLSYAEKYGIK